MWKTLKFRGRKPVIVVLALLILAAVVFIFVINRPPSVEVLVVKVQPYSEKVIAVGQLKPEQVTTLIAEVNGTVKSFHAEEGSTVAAGEILIRIEKTITSDYESARSEYARLRSLASAASADYNNAKTLYAEGAISKSDLTAKKNALEAALSQQKAAELQVEIAADNFGKYQISVPWDSVVLKAYAAPGDYVTAGQALAEIGGLTGYEITADLDEKYFPLLKIGLPVSIAVSDAGIGEIRGEVNSITPKIDTETGTFQVRIKVPESFPYQASDLTVNLEFLLLEKDRAVAIPEKYLLSEGKDGENADTFVLLYDRGKVKKQFVKTTPGFGSNLLVDEGLKDGDLVILPEEGLKEGDPVALNEEGVGN